MNIIVIKILIIKQIFKEQKFSYIFVIIMQIKIINLYHPLDILCSECISLQNKFNFSFLFESQILENLIKRFNIVST